MENSHEYLNFTYWEDVLIYRCDRNIKMLHFNVLLTLIYTCYLNRQFGVDGQKYYYHNWREIRKLQTYLISIGLRKLVYFMIL